MNTKPFLTIDKQIELLEQRGLLFQNKEAAKKDLLSYGYYEIINGYKDCFLANPRLELLLNIFFNYLL